MSQNENIEYKKIKAPKGFKRDSENNIILDSDGNPELEYFTKKHYKNPISNLKINSLKSQIEKLALQSILNTLTSYSSSCVLRSDDYIFNSKHSNQYEEHYAAIKKWIGGFSWEATFQHILQKALTYEEFSEGKAYSKNKNRDDYLTLLEQSRKIITNNPNVIWDKKREEMLCEYFLKTKNPEQNINVLLLMHILVASDIFINFDYAYPDEDKNGYSPEKFDLNPSSNMMTELLKNCDLLKAFKSSAIEKIYSNKKDSNIVHTQETEKNFFRSVISNTALFVVSIITDNINNNIDYYFYREIFRILCNNVFFNVFDIYWGLHKEYFSEWVINDNNYEFLFNFPYNNREHISSLHNFLVNEILMPEKNYQNNRYQRKKGSQKLNPRKGSLRKLFDFRYNIFNENTNVLAKKQQTKIFKTYSKIIELLGLNEEKNIVDYKNFQSNSPENHYNLINIMNFCIFSLFAEDVFDFEVYKNSFSHLKEAICDLPNSILSQNEFIDYCFSIQPEVYYSFINDAIYFFCETLKKNDFSSSELYSVYWKLEEKRYWLKNTNNCTIGTKIDSVLAPREYEEN